MAAGEHLLTGRELVDTVKFPDAIAAGNYEIDIHNPEGSGTSHYYFPAGEYYTVPYRSLVVRDADNLLVAGRCISCDHEAQASVRIMPSMLAPRGRRRERRQLCARAATKRFATPTFPFCAKRL